MPTTHQRQVVRGKKSNTARYTATRNTQRPVEWFHYGSTIPQATARLNFNLHQFLREHVEKQKGNPLNVLDLGCGPGVALGEIKSHFGHKVQTTGITLIRDPQASYAGVDRVKVGKFEDASFDQKFDLIYSVDGVTTHTLNKAAAVKKVITLLRPGGLAVLDLNMPIHPGQARWESVQAELNRQGIQFKPVNGHVIAILKHPKAGIVNHVVQRHYIQE